MTALGHLERNLFGPALRALAPRALSDVAMKPSQTKTECDIGTAG